MLLFSSLYRRVWANCFPCVSIAITPLFILSVLRSTSRVLICTLYLYPHVYGLYTQSSIVRRCSPMTIFHRVWFTRCRGLAWDVLHTWGQFLFRYLKADSILLLTEHPQWWKVKCSTVWYGMSLLIGGYIIAYDNDKQYYCGKRGRISLGVLWCRGPGMVFEAMCCCMQKMFSSIMTVVLVINKAGHIFMERSLGLDTNTPYLTAR